jgi:hypothetical protein
MIIRLKQAAQILLATLREIFDEAPYARFLRRTQTASSPAAYAAFCRERESGQARRPKCC